MLPICLSWSSVKMNRMFGWLEAMANPQNKNVLNTDFILEIVVSVGKFVSGQFQDSRGDKHTRTFIYPAFFSSNRHHRLRGALVSFPHQNCSATIIVTSFPCGVRAIVGSAIVRRILYWDRQFMRMKQDLHDAEYLKRSAVWSEAKLWINCEIWTQMATVGSGGLPLCLRAETTNSIWNAQKGNNNISITDMMWSIDYALQIMPRQYHAWCKASELLVPTLFYNSTMRGPHTMWRRPEEAHCWCSCNRNNNTNICQNAFSVDKMNEVRG